MKFPLYSRVALAEDFAEKGLYRGDVGTIVEHYEGSRGQEPGYEIEILKSGARITTITVRESQIKKPLP